MVAQHMGADIAQSDSTIGDDFVEVLHQRVFRQDWKRAERFAQQTCVFPGVIGGALAGECPQALQCSKLKGVELGAR